MTAIKKYQDLTVWQIGMDLAEACYRDTERFPAREHFGLAAQLRRSAVSVPSNVAEGHNRGLRAAYRNHVSISLGSQAELETQIELARRLGYLSASASPDLLELASRTGRLLHGLLTALDRDLH